MAQTTLATSFKDCKIETSTNGTTWTDISGFASTVDLDGGDRQTSEAYTFDGDTAIITKGKREPIEVTAAIVYSEGVSDPQATVQSAYETGSDLWLRWSPLGGTTGKKQYTAKGTVTTQIYPKGEADGGDPLMTEFTLITPQISTSTAA